VSAANATSERSISQCEHRKRYGTFALRNAQLTNCSGVHAGGLVELMDMLWMLVCHSRPMLPHAVALSRSADHDEAVRRYQAPQYLTCLCTTHTLTHLVKLGHQAAHTLITLDTLLPAFQAAH